MPAAKFAQAIQESGTKFLPLAELILSIVEYNLILSIQKYN